MLKKLRYSVKSFFSVLSGFDRYEQNDGGEWQEVELGQYDDYYTCAKYNNNRHIPFPILDDWEPEEHRLQKAAIVFAAFLKRMFWINSIVVKNLYINVDFLGWNYDIEPGNFDRTGRA